MAIFEYGETGLVPKMEPVVAMAFSFIQEQIDFDNKKYQEKIEARREAGRKGGEAKQANVKARKQTVAKQANANFAKKELANLPEPEPVHDHVYDLMDDERELINISEGDEPIRQKADKMFMDFYCERDGTFDSTLWEDYNKTARAYEGKILCTALSRMRSKGKIMEPVKYLRSTCEGILREPKGG